MRPVGSSAGWRSRPAPAPYQVRTGDFAEDQISVYFTVRQYWGTGPEQTFLDSFRRQREIGEEILQQSVVPRVVRPLAQVDRFAVSFSAQSLSIGCSERRRLRQLHGP